MVWRPPDLAAQPIAAFAQRLDDRREQQRLANGDDLRPEALLCRLRPERREVRRDHVAGDNVRAGRLECRDLRREVAVHELIASGVAQLVTGLCQCGRQPKVWITPGIAVGIIWKKTADHLVGRELVPQREERCDDVLQSPEEMVGPGEALLRVAFAPEEIGLPGAIRGDA